MPTHNKDLDCSVLNLKTTDGRCTMELLPDVGGLINRLCLSDLAGQSVELIAGLRSLTEIQHNIQYRGVVLYPFPNRLDKGAYSHGGKHYTLTQNEADNATALHGFLYQLPAKIVNVQEGLHESLVALEYCYQGQFPGYPFQAKITIEYRLSSTLGLSMRFAVINRHSDPVPVGLGWHPYFQLGRPVDELELVLPEVEHVQVDSRLLPTGKVEAYSEFQVLKSMAGKVFDDCFRVLDRQSPAEAKVVLYSPKDKIGMEVWQSSGPQGYNFIQLCIPPDRQSIAIEPMTCGINAFNTRDGLLELAPEAELSVDCGVRLTN